mmetsp:Transcript_5134/g.13704  ORF Transcript_5134/g.13704 Transcript_5134/m.13704 type:complete len:376 (+) Transcript_5134:1595-2722(+)
MENREELHGVVSRILDVRHLLRDAQERTARVVVQAARGGRGERPRSALVDDEVLRRNVRGFDAAPVKRRLVQRERTHPRPSLSVGTRFVLAVHPPALHQRRVRVHHELVRLPVIPPVRRLPAVHEVAVADDVPVAASRDVIQTYVPHVPGLVLLRVQRDAQRRLLGRGARVEVDEQVDPGGGGGVDGEVDTRVYDVARGCWAEEPRGVVAFGDAYAVDVDVGRGGDGWEAGRWDEGSGAARAGLRRGLGHPGGEISRGSAGGGGYVAPGVRLDLRHRAHGPARVGVLHAPECPSVGFEDRPGEGDGRASGHLRRWEKGRWGRAARITVPGGPTPPRCHGRRDTRGGDPCSGRHHSPSSRRDVRRWEMTGCTPSAF